MTDHIQDRAVKTEKVGHVTFLLVEEWSDCYSLYSESPEHPFSAIQKYLPYDEAVLLWNEKTQQLTEALERKRKGRATANQVYFLYQHGNTVLPTLTWGEASDLIAMQIEQDQQKREVEIQSKRAKFEGFRIGDRVAYTFPKTGVTITGKVTKLQESGDHKRIYIRFDDGGSFYGGLRLDAALLKLLKRIE